MSALPLGLGFYDRIDNVPLLLQNMVFEQCPSNIEDQVSLFSRPGMASVNYQGSSPVRGVFRQGVAANPTPGAGWTEILGRGVGVFLLLEASQM